MASPLNFPYFSSPPPPHQPFAPPPPRVLPPPPHVLPPPPHVLPPPSPSPDNHTTVIIIVFVSCGGLFFLAFLLAGFCCLIKKRKKKTVQEIDIVNVDEHAKVKEDIVKGPYGAEAVVLTIEEDVHLQEQIIKNEKLGEHHYHHGLHGKSASAAESSANNEIGLNISSPNSDQHHHLKHNA